MKFELQRPRLRLLILTVLAAIVPVGVKAQTPDSSTAAPATMLSQSQPDGQHDFDFNIGSWHTHIRRLMHPLAGSTTWLEYNGTVVVKPVWGGLASVEEVNGEGSDGKIRLVELRLYNPESHEWTINDANSADGVIEPPPLIGRFTNGVGVFYDQELLHGHPIFVRQVWSHNKPASYQMIQAFSADGGATWEANFIANVTRDR